MRFITNEIQLQNNLKWRNSVKVEYNDYELVYLVREKNEEALNIIIEKYSPLIGSIASKYYGVGYDYQDYFQEGLVAFIKSIHTFDENAPYSFYSYSMTCVRNAITSTYRSMKRSSGLDYLTDYDQHPPLIAESPTRYSNDVHTFLNGKLILEKVLRKDDQLLSQIEKQCLRYWLEGHNYNEIAMILEMPPKKVDNALSRCKNKLRSLNKVN